MKNKIEYVILLALLLIMPVITISWGDSLDCHSWIAEGDSLYENWEYEASLDAYRNALSIEPGNPEILWRISRIHYRLGDVEKTEGTSETMQAHFQAGYSAGKTAISADSTSSKAHIWYAANLGEIAMTRGVREQIRMSTEVLEESKTALRLQPADDGAMHMIGRWHYEVLEISGISRMFARMLGLPSASYEEALKYFRMAAESDPSYLKHHLFFGKTCIRLKKTEEAREALQNVIDLPAADENDDVLKEEARLLLAEIGW